MFERPILLYTRSAFHVYSWRAVVLRQEGADLANQQEVQLQQRLGACGDDGRIQGNRQAHVVLDARRELMHRLPHFLCTLHLLMGQLPHPFALLIEVARHQLAIAWQALTYLANSFLPATRHAIW